MGTVYRKTVTRPIPAGAETVERKGQRFARWKVNGKARMAPLTVGRDGSERILCVSPFFIAKFRDGDRIVREVSTGCRDETAARSVLADLERRAELVRSGVMTAAEVATGRHQDTGLEEHFAAYLAHLEASGACKEHRTERLRQLRRLAADCGFHRLGDLDRGKLESWLTIQDRNGMGARTRNSYLASAVAFANWCCEPTVGRLMNNPFKGCPKANEKADCRRLRRAMEESELTRLLAAARRRPLLDALTVRRGQRKGQAAAKVRPEVCERLEWLGWERALTYKTLVLTGLRKAELASLSVGQLFLDGPTAYAVLDAADEKNREGSEIVLRSDLAADLRQWLSDKLERCQSEARREGKPIPARLPADMKVFDVPAGLVRILDRDLRLAGIPKTDERGRTLDVHALRHSFCGLLSKGGVAPRVAQAAMRHSTIDLTMNHYTDPKLLDVRSALDALPALPLDGTGREQEVLRATGTGEKGAGAVAPPVAPTSDKRVQTGAIPSKTATLGVAKGVQGRNAASAESVKRNNPLSFVDNGLQKAGEGIRTLNVQLGKLAFCH